MRNIQKVIATGISVAMFTTMCVIAPAAASAEEATTTTADTPFLTIATGENNDQVIATLTEAQVKELAAKETKDGQWMLEGKSNTGKVFYSPAGQYVTYKALAEFAGVESYTTVVFGKPGDFPKMESMCATKDTVDNGMFFPAWAPGSTATEGAVATPGAVLLSYTSVSLSDEAPLAGVAIAKAKADYEAGGATTDSMNSAAGTTLENYQAGSITSGMAFWGGGNTVVFKNASKSYSWTAKAAKSSVKYSATKKQTVKITAKGAQGKVTYSVVSAPKAGKKAVSVSKSGVVTFAKKAAKGTYKISVKCAGKDLYKASTKTVSIKVK